MTRPERTLPAPRDLFPQAHPKQQRAPGRLGLAMTLGALALAPGRPAHAAEPAVGLRSLAMGDTLRAAATGAEGALLNPSGIGITPMLTAAAFYSLRVQTLGHILHASISDSLMQRWISLGLYYNFIYETPHIAYQITEGGQNPRTVLVRDSKIVRTGSESGVVVAVPVSDRFSIGGTVKYADYNIVATPGDGSLPIDFNRQTPRFDADGNVNLGSVGHVVTFDLGITARLYDQLRVAIVGQNLWPHGVELPSRLGLGLSYRPTPRWLLAADAVINFTGSLNCTGMYPDPCTETSYRTTWRFGAGLEYSIADRVPLRVGYLYDSEIDSHHFSGGLGYFSATTGIGVDFAIRQRFDGGDETVMLLGLRYVKQ